MNHRSQPFAILLAAFLWVIGPNVHAQESPEIPMHVNEQGVIVYPINEKSDVIEYPFGYTEPVVTASPLRISRIELEEGEEVVGQAVGDATRWQIDYSLQGEGELSKVIFFVKPIIDDISTNFVITTNRRTYDITLEAPKIKDPGTNPETHFTRGISFYYPDEASEKLNEQIRKDQERIRREQGRRSRGPSFTRPDSSSAFERYKYEEGKYGFPWEPVAIWDNNRHVFIQLPSDFDIESQELPGVFLTNRFGDKQQMNFSYDPDSKIIRTDRVFQQAKLTYQFQKRGFLGFGRVTRDRELLVTLNDSE